jgi:hypothetical protein
VPSVDTDDGDAGGAAVLEGGPLDGRVHPVQAGVDELLVVMTDGQQHRYVRTPETRSLADGRAAAVFGWRGRHVGPP